MARKITRNKGFRAKLNAERSKFLVETVEATVKRLTLSDKIISRALNGRRNKKT